MALPRWCLTTPFPQDCPWCRGAGSGCRCGGNRPPARCWRWGRRCRRLVAPFLSRDAGRLARTSRRFAPLGNISCRVPLISYRGRVSEPFGIPTDIRKTAPSNIPPKITQMTATTRRWSCFRLGSGSTMRKPAASSILGRWKAKPGAANLRAVTQVNSIRPRYAKWERPFPGWDEACHCR